jgi:hypothetical protein
MPLVGMGCDVLLDEAVHLRPHLVEHLIKAAIADGQVGPCFDHQFHQPGT